MDQTAAARIAEDLQALGVRRGGVLLVHSSFRSLGPVPGGIDTLLEGLWRALGEQGTLAFPALSYQYVTREHPVFDIQSTPCNVGAIPEYFRKLPGTLRSMHPTHSVSAQGPQAAVLLDGHRLDRTPGGIHSPYARLRDLGGQVLMLGCGLLPNTSLHAVEEAADAPYLLEPEPVEFTLADAHGSRTQACYRCHGHFAQHYDRIRQPLLGHGLAEGPVLQAQCHLLEAPALWQAALAMLKEDIYCLTRE